LLVLGAPLAVWMGAMVNHCVTKGAMTCFPVNVVSEFAEIVTLMRSNLLENALDARRISKAVMKAQGIQVFVLCLPLGLTIPRWSGGYRC